MWCIIKLDTIRLSQVHLYVVLNQYRLQMKQCFSTSDTHPPIPAHTLLGLEQLNANWMCVEFEGWKYFAWSFPIINCPIWVSLCPLFLTDRNRCFHLQNSEKDYGWIHHHGPQIYLPHLHLFICFCSKYLPMLWLQGAHQLSDNWNLPVSSLNLRKWI